MASEVERIGEECRRYSERMVERMAEAKSRREARSRERAEQAAAETQDTAERTVDQDGREHGPQAGMDEQWRPDSGRSPRSGQESEGRSFPLQENKYQRLRDEERRTQQQVVAPPAGRRVSTQGVQGVEHPIPEGQSDELDTNEAIARSIAARRRNNVVAPIDDDGDDEADYYRRKSWLV
ncbi:hypothetical protein [Nocardia sienata]|uniref:hypothetical protein n=1 Tax=Nocardia sienata TaxID=248552 RepID=UPI000A78D2B6|nr:hypothetical protein [Nocardia sienata]